MPFTQVDDNTVQDEEGNRYFIPFMGSPGAPPGLTQPGGGPPSPSANNLAPPEGTPDPASVVPVPPPSLPSFQAPADPYQGQGTDFAVPLQATPRAPSAPTREQLLQARQAAMGSDVTAFSQAGGTARSDEDFARIMGGHAAHEAETAKAKAEADAIARAGQVEKLKETSRMVMDTATQYEAKVNELMTDAKSKWSDWRKKNEDAGKQLIDPSKAFNDGGTLSKINWGLYFFAAGLQGGNSVDQAVGMMNKFVEDDMAMQRANIENRHKSLNEERLGLQENDRINKDNIAQWYFAKNLRLQAVGQALDAKIAEMGLPAAQKAGLLGARDAIEKEILKGQGHVADHYFDDGQRKAREAHDIYMERLKSKLRIQEDAYKETLKKGEKGDTLPTNTQLGLQMVDKSTGKVVPEGQIPLKVKGEKAVEAGKITADANYEASQLRDAKQMLKGMSTSDIARGGTPEFASVVTEVIQARAVRYNGHRLSDKDLEVAAKEVLGANVMVKDGVISNMATIIRQVGNTKEGIEKVFKRELRNLSKQTINKLHPYIDSETAQKYDIQYNIQETNNEELSHEADDANTALTKAAGSANIKELLYEGPREPIPHKSMYNRLSNGRQKLGDKVINYAEERKKGRGVGGGLPVLPDEQQEYVDQAIDAFKRLPAEEIERQVLAYAKNPKVGPEAAFEIFEEGKIAQADAKSRETAVVQAALDEWKQRHQDIDPGSIGQEGAIPHPQDPYDTEGAYKPEVKKYLESDLVNEMRRRAGLEPRKK